MAITVVYSEDPAWVLSAAEEYLHTEPVLHNLILTLLHTRASHHEPGRYWVAKNGENVVGVVFQSPLQYPALVSPMDAEIIGAVVDAICDAGVVLPGVSGTAADAARFAGQWAERQKTAAVPVQGLRIYEVSDVQEPTHANGRIRQAGLGDRDLLIEWIGQFYTDVGQAGTDPAPSVDRRLPAGHFWIWEDGEPVSLAAHSEAVQGVMRISAVFTPLQKRNHGYAGACVAKLSQQILDKGYRPILYTDLGNPQSNSIYRRIGYRAVAESLRYQFE